LLYPFRRSWEAQFGKEIQLLPTAICSKK